MHVFKDETTGAYQVHDEIDVIRGFPKRVERAVKGALRTLKTGAWAQYVDYRAKKALTEAKRRAMCVRNTETHTAPRRVACGGYVVVVRHGTTTLVVTWRSRVSVVAPCEIMTTMRRVAVTTCTRQV